MILFAQPPHSIRSLLPRSPSHRPSTQRRYTRPSSLSRRSRRAVPRELACTPPCPRPPPRRCIPSHPSRSGSQTSKPCNSPVLVPACRRSVPFRTRALYSTVVHTPSEHTPAVQHCIPARALHIDVLSLSPQSRCIVPKERRVSGSLVDSRHPQGV